MVQSLICRCKGTHLTMGTPQWREPSVSATTLFAVQEASAVLRLRTRAKACTLDRGTIHTEHTSYEGANGARAESCISGAPPAGGLSKGTVQDRMPAPSLHDVARAQPSRVSLQNSASSCDDGDSRECSPRSGGDGSVGLHARRATAARHKATALRALAAGTVLVVHPSPR